MYRLRGFFRPFRPPVNLPWCEIRCMGNLRSSSTSSLSPPLPQHKNCEVVSPRIHPSPFLDYRLALITPSSSFTFALLKPSTSWRGSRSLAAAMMSLVIAIHFSNSHTMHYFSHPSCLTWLVLRPKVTFRGILAAASTHTDWIIWETSPKLVDDRNQTPE